MQRNIVEPISKYLFLDHGGVLDGTVIETSPEPGDLVLSDNLGEGLIRVLRNGISVVNQLNELVTNYGYDILFHSKNKEDDQMRIWKELCNACELRGITFPAVVAMAVFDPGKYNGITSDKPRMITHRKQQNEIKAVAIRMVAYGVEKDGKACVREALSRGLGIEESHRCHSVVFDDGASVIKQAIEEKYQAKLIGDLNAALGDVLRLERCKTETLNKKKYKFQLWKQKPDQEKIQSTKNKLNHSRK